jgi:serine/threonine protein kinase
MFQPGQILQERYVLRQSLGKKAGRRTLLAHDLQTQEHVAIKLLIFGSDFEWDDLKLFEREAETLKTLDYSSIPRYLDSFELDLPYHKGFGLVQTYIAAKSLTDHLKGGRTFSEIEVKEIAKALLKILIYLHGRYPPVIHRDIKPSNILLGDRSGNNLGRVYLVDFGSVQTIEGEGTITVVGTYGYMPPEQFGDRAVPASDLYSLGATLIHLMTGSLPATLMQKDFRIRFDEQIQMHPGLMDWLATLVEPSLKYRFSSAQKAFDTLEKEVRVLPKDFPKVVLEYETWTPRVRASLRITAKSEEKLEIRQKNPYPESRNVGFCATLFPAFVFGYISLLLGGIAYGFGMAILVMVICRIICLIERRHPSPKIPKREFFIRFNVKNNQFEYNNGFQSVSGLISTICYMSIFEAIGNRHTSGDRTNWGFDIRVRSKTHKLLWNLSEEECIWLVNEIQTWLHSVRQKLRCTP